MKDKDKCCGNCKYNEYYKEKVGRKVEKHFFCANKDSYFNGCEHLINEDSCSEWEEK